MRFLADLGEPRPADINAGGREALVLAIERQVPGKLIHQDAGDEADIGPAVIDDTLRGRGAHDALVFFELHHRAMILEDLDSCPDFGSAGR